LQPFTPSQPPIVSRPFAPPQPQARSGLFTPPGFQAVAQHPFIPGASVHPIVPANASEPGSAPGTPNLAAMVMRSFQPAVMERTPLATNPAAGVPQPNPQFNFGGGQLPPGTGTMIPQQQAF
jgi:hypothetical protein